ncbi:DNA polymerase IV [Alphaproteobacteria bacterium HT1-32]|nr:DNA polymerase IV [Alphaproteobacteria bacterium HT1-32]
MPPALCRSCLTREPGNGSRCRSCGSPRVIRHAELFELSIAHIDCDAFYATVEKRDNPELRDKPVIVGGMQRGVVSAACYVARTRGVHSAMPMYKALKACPDAVVIKPDMTKYAKAGHAIRTLMQELTPQVEPLSIDEAFLDLSGTERLHHGSPAETLARLILRIEKEVGVTASIGLSYNKFLAKVASDLDKPKGFAVIGQAEAVDFLATQSVKLMWGVGRQLQKKLQRDGLPLIGDLQRKTEKDLISRYGSIGSRLANFSHGRDNRRIEPSSGAKSVSAETTFNDDISDTDALREKLWPLCQKVSARLKAKELAGEGVILKLKTPDFRLITRSQKMPGASQLAENLYRTAVPLLVREATGRQAFRLIGVGVQGIVPARFADAIDLADPDSEKRAKIERAMDAVREKFGNKAVDKGRSWKPEKNER